MVIRANRRRLARCLTLVARQNGSTPHWSLWIRQREQLGADTQTRTYAAGTHSIRSVLLCVRTGCVSRRRILGRSSLRTCCDKQTLAESNDVLAAHSCGRRDCSTLLARRILEPLVDPEPAQAYAFANNLMIFYLNAQSAVQLGLIPPGFLPAYQADLGRVLAKYPGLRPTLSEMVEQLPTARDNPIWEPLRDEVA